ncbi:H/ACA ribonucleoprotein complex non-core subunit NAF1 [Chanodichthys erythropterus]|uniref:H/ACA ribonucleoprotein complex non-core subunit NAF1 n=1 Tax=Chanodichthys erythropterus TaxID=933992 RepID=UPI00351EF82C
MENSSTENVIDGQDQSETKSENEKMELDINTTEFQTETKGDQSAGPQLGPTDETCTSSQSEQIEDQISSIQSEHIEDQCSRGQLGPAEGPYTGDQSIDTEGQSSSIQSEQKSSGHLRPTLEPCTSDLSGLADQMSVIQSEQTGDQSSSIQSEQTSEQKSSGQLGPTSEPCISHLSGLASDQMSVIQSDQTGGQSSSIQTGPAKMQCGVVVSPHSGTGSLALLGMQYRGNSSDDNCSDSDSDSSSSTSSSSSSSSSSSTEPLEVVMNNADDDDGVVAMGNEKKPVPLKTHDELLIEDLPAVENLIISLPEDTEMEPIGTISSIVEQLVIVESYKNTPALNEDSVLFNKNRNSVGKVFEIFGPVCQPYYVLRFNSHDDIDQKDVKVRDPVYFAPKIKDFTDYIFTERLHETKGSDASWKNDQEPPPEALDFSDDEQEKLAKQKLKEQKRRQQNDSDSEDESDAHKAPQKAGRRKPRQNRNVPRGQHHNRGGGFHSNYHAHPHFPPDYMFPHPDPHMFPFQHPMMPPFPRPPPFHMGMAPWPPGPNQGFMFQPPPPPPPPPPFNQ